MAVQFNIEILSEKLLPPDKSLFSKLFTPVEDQVRYFARQASGRCDQILPVHFYQLPVNPGKLVVVPLNISERTEFSQILVPVHVFSKKALLISLVPVLPGELLFMPVFH